MLMHAMVPLIGLMATVSPTPVVAQDGSWLAWHGCWRSMTEDTPVGEVVCVLRGADASEVRLSTVVDGVVTSTTTIRTDGVARELSEGGCRGTETARWSADGRRVYVKAVLDCEGIRRETSGVLAMVAEQEWVSVQAASVGGRDAAHSVRYRAIAGTNMPAEIRAGLDDARELARESARLHVSAPLDLDAVVEASTQMPAPAVEALLAARGTGFDIDARRIVQLEEAGVPNPVIDMVVALTFPARFAVREAEVAPVAESGYRDDNRGWAESCYDPYWDPYPYYGYNRTCSRYYGRFGYSRYSPWDPYGWRYGYGTGSPVVVIIQPRDDETPQRGPAQYIKGGGYTRVSTASSGSAQPRGSTSAGSAGTRTTTTTTTTSSGSGSTANPPASGSGSSTTRRAVPRTGGGGGQ